MANELKVAKPAGTVTGSIADGPKRAAARVRKTYDHEMTPQEKYALQTVQRASSALKVVNDAIKSGKTVNAEFVKLCHQINEAAGDMLFS